MNTIPIPTESGLEAKEYADWTELPKELRDKCVGYLKEQLPSTFQGEIRDAYSKWGSDWMKQFGPYPFHFSGGMNVRNLLRDIVEDAELPSGNWDDYYCQALLRACGAVSA